MLYKYSDGSVKGPRAFTYNDVQYGADVFHKWTPEQLSEVGIKTFTEDAVPQFYTAGIPVDVETATTVTRTYPNAVYNEDLYYDNLDLQIAAVEAKYNLKLVPVRDLFMTASLSDGPSMNGKIQVARNEWAQIVADKDAEIKALLGV